MYGDTGGAVSEVLQGHQRYPVEPSLNAFRSSSDNLRAVGVPGHMCPLDGATLLQTRT
jgi:hypothetical protein